MIFGYARVSTSTQSYSSQLDTLNDYGCEKIYSECVSGAKSERVEYNKMIEAMREGDVLVVYKLDRIARSLKDLIDKIQCLSDNGISFVSISDSIDTTTPQGKLMLNIIGSFAEFERDIIRERTMAGLQAARVRGRTGGRPSTLNSKQIEKMKEMHKDKSIPISDILDTFKISRSTLYRVVGK